MTIPFVESLREKMDHFDVLLKQIEADKEKGELTPEDYQPFYDYYQQMMHEFVNATSVGRELIADDSVPRNDCVQLGTFNFDAKEAKVKMPRLKATKVTYADGTVDNDLNEQVLNPKTGKNEWRRKADKVHAEYDSKLYHEMSEAGEYWRNLPLWFRVEVVKEFRRLLVQNKEYFVAGLMIELGKTREVADGEITKMLEYLDETTDKNNLKRTFGYSVKYTKGEEVFTVVWRELEAKNSAVFPASNYPLALMMSQWVGSLVCGSVIMHKPTGNSVLGALGMDELFQIAMGNVASDIKHANNELIEELNTKKELVDLKNFESIKKFASKVSKVVLGYEFGIHRCSDHVTFVGGADAWDNTIQPQREESIKHTGDHPMPELGAIGFQLVLKSAFPDGTTDKKGSLLSNAFKAFKDILAGIITNNGLRCTAISVALFEKGTEAIADAIRDEIWNLQDEKNYGMALRKNSKFGPSFNYKSLVGDDKNKALIGELRELLLELGLTEKLTKDGEGHFFGGKVMDGALDKNLITPFHADITSLIKDKKLSEIDPRLLKYMQNKELFGAVVLSAKGLEKSQMFELAKNNQLKMALGAIASDSEFGEIAAMGLGYTSCDRVPKEQAPKGIHGGHGGVGGATHGDDAGKGLLDSKSCKFYSIGALEAFLDKAKEKLGTYFKRVLNPSGVEKYREAKAAKAASALSL